MKSVRIVVYYLQLLKTVVHESFESSISNNVQA